MCSALDRFKISDRAAVHIIIQTLEALRLNADNFVINRTTLREKRSKNRKMCDINAKKNFQVVHIYKHHSLEDFIFFHM